MNDSRRERTFTSPHTFLDCYYSLSHAPEDVHCQPRWVLKIKWAPFGTTFAAAGGAEAGFEDALRLASPSIFLILTDDPGVELKRNDHEDLKMMDERRKQTPGTGTEEDVEGRRGGE